MSPDNMSRRLPNSKIAFATIAAIVTGAIYISACGEERVVFTTPAETFVSDAATPDAGCGLRCLLDGRSVMDTCSGRVVETCREDLACGAGVCQEPCAAAAAAKSSNGCDFYLQAPVPGNFYQGCYAAYVVNQSNRAAEISLELKGQKLDLSKAVWTSAPGAPSKIQLHSGPILPGESVIVYVSDQDRSGVPLVSREAPPCPEGVVPATFANPLPKWTGRGSAFHFMSTVPVGLSAIYPAAGGSSWVTTATLLLPVTTWSRENMIINAWSQAAVQGPVRGPSAQIVAAEDGTDVTIHPTRDIAGGEDVAGTAQGVAITYRLNKGEVLQLDQAAELTGSFVASTKPAAIFGGHECMVVPSDVRACDMGQQQLPALAQWGTEYAAAGYRPRRDSESEQMGYRIVAARDGTLLDYDPPQPPKGAPLALAAGEVATLSAGVGEPFVVRTQDADHPIYMAAYMTGGAPMRGVGDPEFVNVVPAGQYQSAYSFYADPTYSDTSITIIRRRTDGEFRDVWLECAGVLTGWNPIGTRGQYEWRRVDLARSKGPGEAFDAGTCALGLQRMRSDGEFTATLWGWDLYTSYAYPGGTAVRSLTTASFAPVH